MEKKTIGVSVVSLAAAATLFGASPASADLVDCTKYCEPGPGTPGLFHKIGVLTDVLYKFQSDSFYKIDVFHKIDDVFYELGVAPIGDGGTGVIG